MAVKGIFFAALVLAVLIGIALPRPGARSHNTESQITKLAIE